jgi:quercetin dioxygenase-like cupin family protein
MVVTHKRFDPLAVDIESIPWEEPSPSGSRYALLAGHPEVPGAPFAFALRLSAGFVDPPHTHHSELVGTVRMGRLLVGFGRRPTRGGEAVVAVGETVTIPAGVPHYGEALETSIVIGQATGPWRTTYEDTGEG